MFKTAFAAASETSVVNSEVVDDYAGDISTTALLTAGSSLTINPDFEFDEDWVKISGGEDGGIFRLFADAGHGKYPYPRISIYDVDGNIVLDHFSTLSYRQNSEGDFGYGLHLAPGETIFVSITGFYVPYTLSLTEIIGDAGNTPETAATLIPDGTPVAGAIEYEGDTDVYAVDVEAGQTLFLRSASGTSPGTRDLLLSTGGEQLNMNKIILNGLSYYYFTAPSSDTYYVSTGVVTGVLDYTLTAFLQQDDHGNDFASATAAGIGTSTNYSLLETGEDHDVFSFTPSVSGNYGASMDMWSIQSVLESAHIDIYDSEHNLISSGDQDGMFAGASFWAIGGATYYVDISSTGNNSNGLTATGTYGFQMTSVDADTTGTLFGTDLTDFAHGSSAPVAFLFGGDDVFTGSYGDEWASGGDGDDELMGGGGNDNLFGGDGDDELVGGDGNDALHGDAGQDNLFGDSGNDNLFGGDGADVLRGGEGNDTLHGDAGQDYLFGEEGNDFLFGGDGADVLYARYGTDTLVGGDGNDLLYAMFSTVKMLGGAGSDTFAVVDIPPEMVPYYDTEAAPVVNHYYISDFDVTRDRLYINSVGGADPHDILIQQQDKDTLITLTNGTTVLLYNTPAELLSDWNMIFPTNQTETTAKDSPAAVVDHHHMTPPELIGLDSFEGFASPHSDVDAPAPIEYDQQPFHPQDSMVWDFIH